MSRSDKTILLPRGFSFSAAACGLKRQGLDLAILVSEFPSAAAAVFTRNLVCAAPVQTSRDHMKLARSRMRAVIVNSGNANCATGPQSLKASQRTAAAMAGALHCHPAEVLVCSTGVIGVPLRVEKILGAAAALVGNRRTEAKAFKEFSHAILTTDTQPKWAGAEVRIGGNPVRILGCAKGAGMIQPNMATMLAFLATDANIAAPLLQRALRFAVQSTFNAITVDGDTSTNDTVTLLANGASSCGPIRSGSREFARFQAALHCVCLRLALAIVADGEGARRVIEIEVRGARSVSNAEKVARTIANSPLVKTALAGADPNWGRILAAAGRAGVKFDPGKAKIRVAGMEMYRNGREQSFNERQAHRKLSVPYVPVVLDLQEGSAQARVWTCDFTAEYVNINASYRS